MRAVRPLRITECEEGSCYAKPEMAGLIKTCYAKPEMAGLMKPQCKENMSEYVASHKHTTENLLIYLLFLVSKLFHLRIQSRSQMRVTRSLSCQRQKVG